MEIEGKVFRSKVFAVDPSFLTLFGYPLLHGDPETALQEPGQIVLTASAANKFYGRTEVVGEIIALDENSSAKIVGVVPDSPPNTHLKFNMLLSYASMKSTFDKREDPWDSNDTYTYLELGDAVLYPKFQENLSRLSDRLRKEDLIPDERVVSEKIGDIHLHSNKSYEPEQNGSATIVLFLLGVALLVVVIAILNYINLSTAKAMDRAKEAGIRKVVGSSIAQLRMRFFVESILLNLMAGVLSVFIIWIVFNDYKALAGLPESLDIVNDPETWIVLGLLMITSTLLAGVFPAFILGSFRPLDVLKGKFNHSPKGILMRKALVVVQFSIAIFLLIQTFTANKQLRYMLNKDLGMNTEKVVVISAPPPEGQKTHTIASFKSSLLARPTFINVSQSWTVPGLSTSTMSSTTDIVLDEEARDLKNNFFFNAVDSNFFATLEMEIITGHGFSEVMNFEHPFVVNEEALRVWGIADPQQVLGKTSTFWGRENTLVGVIKDFHQLGAKSAHIPMIFLGDEYEPDFISIRLSDGGIMEQISELEDIYLEHFPNSTFDFFFLDQNFDAQYRGDQQFQQIFSVLSGFAILITCLGLFGLASFTVAKRTKEIGIRKVLGANISQIISLISKDFIVLVAISSLIAIPMTYFLVENWLNQYAFRITINLWLFVLPTLFALMAAFITVFSKAYQASTINPSTSLRDE